MMPFLIGQSVQTVRTHEIIPFGVCDIAIANAVTVTSLTSVSAADLTEKFVVPSVWLDRVGSTVALEIEFSFKNNDGTSRYITFDEKINSTSVLAGLTSVFATAAQTRAALLRFAVTRSGATTGHVSSFLHMGGAGAPTGSGTPIGGYNTASAATAYGHNTAAPLPAVGNNVTLAVTAALSVASVELTLAVTRRRLYTS